ncbi:hypothetical protein J6590_076121 [Homalodisca vitripennis]|nr:hypothetical protein J6590_076121 [Homalodisca vitripennis]
MIYLGLAAHTGRHKVMSNCQSSLALSMDFTQLALLARTLNTSRPKSRAFSVRLSDNSRYPILPHRLET